MFFEFHGKTISINMPRQQDLEAEVSRRFAAAQGFSLATVNLDHLVKMADQPGFTAAYARQDLVVADGRPIVWLSKLAQRPVDLMPGSDLVRPLCEWAARAGVPVALVGSTDIALHDAKEALTAQVPRLDIAWCHAPSGVFDPEGSEADQILSELEVRGVALCFLALGAPKQEVLAARGRQLAPRCGFASVGAGLDFLGGHQRRAPAWVRAIALEWLWRALSAPTRLVPRYLRCAAILPGHTLRAIALRKTPRSDAAAHPDG